MGIPAHRLPREVLDREIELITNLGVEIKTNTPLGPNLSIDDLLNSGYKAVYLALGAHKGIELGIPGEKAQGVRQGVDFLREVNLNGKAPMGKRVAIVGGGNVAIDVSRCAARLGAEEVMILYRRTRAEMPAWEEEIQAAEAEGVQLTYLCAPPGGPDHGRRGHRAAVHSNGAGGTRFLGQKTSCSDSGERIRYRYRPVDPGHRPDPRPVGPGRCGRSGLFQVGHRRGGPGDLRNEPQRGVCGGRSPDRALGGHRRHCGGPRGRGIHRTIHRRPRHGSGPLTRGQRKPILPADPGT